MITHAVQFEPIEDKYGDPVFCPNCGEHLGEDITYDRAGTETARSEPYCEECFYPLSPCCGAEIIEDIDICSECKEHC